MMTDSIYSNIDCIKIGTNIAVSNGLFKSQFGTSCWILENDIGTERIIGLVDVPGSNDDDDAYRSELAGLYGISLVITVLLKQEN